MRSLRLTLILSVAFAAFLLPSPASADGITWTISGVTLSDTGTVTGSFNYNSVTNTYSAIDVTSTAGTLFSGAVYTTLTDGFLSGSTLLGLGPDPFYSGDLTGKSAIELIFNDPLTNFGGSEPVTVDEFICNDSTCSTTTVRSSSTGNVTGAPLSTPEPASFLLLASGLLAFTLFRRLR